MFTVISRIIHYGFTNFWRNIWLSAATVAVMAMALLVFLGLIFFNVITDSAVNSVQDKIEISVYFKTSAPEDEILRIKQSLESLPEVKSIEYISSDRALEIFKDRHKDDQAITQAINELNNNPLEASLNIKADKPGQYADIAKYLDSPSLKEYVDNVSYTNNQVVIDRLTSIINSVNRGGLILTIFLTLIAGLVVFNTIRIVIYSNRDEIGITRVVGAPNSLVRGPYVVEGAIAGVIAAIIGFIIVAPAIYFVSPYFSAFIPGLNLFEYFYTHIPSLFLYELLFGVGIGCFSSFFAVKRYLKN
jgi:cell division transport system permease protein